MIERLPRFISEKAQRLIDAGIDQGGAEIEIILCYLLKCDRLKLHLEGPQLIGETVIRQLDEIIARRAERYPLQYILGEAWFYGRRFAVNPDVMVPTPETEGLVESALRFVKAARLERPRILDLGTGSGVIAVTLACELPAPTVVALDVSDRALAVARENASALGCADRIEFRQSDFFDAVHADETFHLILSNPPYITEEDYKALPPEVLADPKLALTSGVTGLEAVKVILENAPNHLAPSGRIMFEIGYNQAEQVQQLTAEDERYKTIVIMKDLNNIDRVVILGCD